MIKGFIFDLDGVITETAELHFIAWRNVAKLENIDYTVEQNNNLKGIPRRETMEGILKIHNRTDLSDERIDELCKIKNDAYVEALNTDLSESNILPGIVDFLKQSKNAGITMAIASSSRNAPAILEKLDLIKYFDFIVDPASVAKGKPAPDLYLAAAKGINMDVSEVVGFEDAIIGVDGLFDAKIKTVAITYGFDTDWSKADIIIDNTTELDLEAILKL